MYCAAEVLQLSLVNPLVQLPFGLAPALVAVVVRRWVTKEGFADAGLALRFRKNRRYFLMAWLGPLLFAVTGVAAAAAAGSRTTMTPWVTTPILMAMVIPLIPIYWGEEFGWTGYLRPRLFPDRPLLSVGATALIWAVWHYPLAFFGYVEFGNPLLGLLVWTVSILFQEVILAWLYQSTGSIWTASLAHAGNNMVLFLLVGQVLPDSTSMSITLVATIPLALAACWIVATGRLRAIQGKPLREADISGGFDAPSPDRPPAAGRVPRH
ncbi:CPBP family intramembrane metalloprotease [Nocardia panacis]|uniref:CPBP family intramembrane metalloprotease n=2 Tax=Nocardia panacis TaxID=2340916 RepID=A0A3A4K893_9NOCA|nr:CPBP family intramembrane metalloprotease [Nocardia panacis]